MRTMNIVLAGLTFTILACGTVSMWVLEPMITKQKFVVIPAIEKEIKIRVVSAVEYKTKVRPIAHVGRPVMSLRDQLEESGSMPDEICMLRDGEWRERIHNAPCLDVGEQAMRFQKGEATLVKITKSKSNEVIGECFNDEGRLYCQSYHPTRKRYRKL